ncbi:C40 family peptidase [Clostridium sp. UBA4548]|uniref:C40 family peptidase n=1 Tax=Clostridium sp. UBA4548 TaxID=1946361 RepID=UPI0025BC2F74|nr:C40 family peptidase [Clostridium sp. UBA4548]
MKKSNFKSIMTKICLLFAMCLLVSFNPVKAEAATVSGQDIVNEAKKYLGVPYQWGGNGPSTFDCSGLTKYVYNQFGIYLPRTANEQMSVGTYVAKSELQPGDLVFFGYNAHAGHVGIYIGSDQFIEAPDENMVVRISTLSRRSDYIQGRRIVSSLSIKYRLYVTSDKVAYYSQATNNDSLIKGYLSKGEVLGCYEKVGNWYNTPIGWIYYSGVSEMTYSVNFIVANDNVNYYAKDSNDDSLILGHWNKGDQITIDAKYGNWYHTSAGFVYYTDVMPVYKCNFIVNSDRVPYYAKDSNDDSLILGYWNKGDQITITGISGNWYQTSAGYVYYTNVSPAN